MHLDITRLEVHKNLINLLLQKLIYLRIIKIKKINLTQPRFFIYIF